jgi:hypothetical protein
MDAQTTKTSFLDNIYNASKLYPTFPNFRDFEGLDAKESVDLLISHGFPVPSDQYQKHTLEYDTLILLLGKQFVVSYELFFEFPSFSVYKEPSEEFEKTLIELNKAGKSIYNIKSQITFGPCTMQINSNFVILYENGKAVTNRDVVLKRIRTSQTNK